MLSHFPHSLWCLSSSIATYTDFIFAHNCSCISRPVYVYVRARACLFLLLYFALAASLHWLAMPCVLPTQNQLYAYYIARCNFHQVSKPNKAVLQLLEEDELSLVSRLESESAQIGVPVTDLAHIEMHSYHCQHHSHRWRDQVNGNDTHCTNTPNTNNEKECTCSADPSDVCPLCAITSVLAHVKPLAHQRAFRLPSCNTRTILSQSTSVATRATSATGQSPAITDAAATTVYLGPRGMMALLDLIAVLPLLEVIDLSNVHSWYDGDFFLSATDEQDDRAADEGYTSLYNDPLHHKQDHNTSESHTQHDNDHPYRDTKPSSAAAAADAVTDDDAAAADKNRADSSTAAPSSGSSSHAFSPCHHLPPYSGNAVTWRLCQVVQSLRRVRRVDISGQPVGCAAAQMLWHTIQACPQLVVLNYTDTAVEQQLRAHVDRALRLNARRWTRSCIAPRLDKDAKQPPYSSAAPPTKHDEASNSYMITPDANTCAPMAEMTTYDDGPLSLPPCLLEITLLDRKTVREQELLYQLLTHNDNFASLMLDACERRSVVRSARVMTTAEVVQRCRAGAVGGGGLRGDGLHLFVIQSGAIHAAVDRTGVVLRQGDYFGDTYTSLGEMTAAIAAASASAAVTVCRHAFSSNVPGTGSLDLTRSKLNAESAAAASLCDFPASALRERERGWVYAIPLESCAPLLHRWRARVGALYPVLGRCVPTLHAVGTWTRLRACTCAMVHKYGTGALVQACGATEAYSVYVVLQGTFAACAAGLAVRQTAEETGVRREGVCVEKEKPPWAASTRRGDSAPCRGVPTPTPGQQKRMIGAVFERYDVFGFEAAVSRHRCSSVETVAGSGPRGGDEEAADATTASAHAVHVCARIGGTGARLLIAQLRPVLCSLATSFSQHDDLRLCA